MRTADGRHHGIGRRRRRVAAWLAGGLAVLAPAATAGSAVAKGTPSGPARVQWVHPKAGPGGIGFDAQGRVVAVATRDGRVPVDRGAGGLSIKDPVSGLTAATTGSVRATSGGGLRQRTIVPSLSARVDVTYDPGPDGTIHVRGAITDLRGSDRVLDTVFGLPLAPSGVWDKDLVDPQPFTATSTVASQTGLPLAAVRGTDSEYALAYAIDPGDASRFEIGVQPGAASSSFFLRQKWGLSPAASGALHSRAPFGFTIDLGVRREWGFRSALQRYYDRSPDLFANPAAKRCRDRDGNVDREAAYGTWQYLPRSLYARPQSLAYHMSGIQKDGATTVPQLAANEDWKGDNANCVGTLPYTIPAQSEITNLDTLPADYDEAIAAFDSWRHAPMPFGSANGPNSYRSDAEQKRLIDNGGLYTPDGKYVTNIRNTDWSGNSVTFPTDPNPQLFAHDSRITSAKYLLDYYVPLMLADRRVDGIFSDSLFGWGRYMDYRKDHYAAARIPLTYSEKTDAWGTAFVPGLYNDFSQLEYLRELRRRLHDRGKILMTNGMKNLSGESRAFDGFESDVVGTETQSTDLVASDSTYTALRATAASKPVMNITHNGWNGIEAWNDPATVDTMWKRGVLYGVAPSSTGGDSLEAISQPDPVTAEHASMSPLEIQAQDRYLPALKELMAAGWNALTGVRASSPAVRVERYGSGRDLYLVVYNEGDDAQGVSFTADRTMVPGIDARRVSDVLDGGAAPEDLRRALAGYGTADLAAGQLEVLHFGR